MTARTNTCLWCGVVAKNATEHMIHVTEAHPETIGRGRTMSRQWSCWRCGTDNRSVTHTCEACGWEHNAVRTTNLERTFIVHTPPDQSAPIDYVSAIDVVRTFARATGAKFDDRRHEAWDGDTRTAWLEVAVVTAGTMYRRPQRWS